MDSQQRKIAKHIQRMKIVMAGKKVTLNGSKAKRYYFLNQIEKGRVMLQKLGTFKNK